MDNGYSPTILQGQHTNDDEILAKTPPLDPKALGGDSSVIIMELLQRFKVRDVMKRQIISVARNASLREAQRLMRENRISGLPVCEEGRLYGIVSVNDIITALDNGWIEDTCEKHMACNLVVLEAGMPISFALRYFNNYTYGRFPVLDSDRKLVGILSQRDVMRALLYELSVEIRKLERKTSNNAPTHATGEHYFRREWAVVRNDLSRAGHAANDIKGILRERKVSASTPTAACSCCSSRTRRSRSPRRTAAPASPTSNGPAATARPPRTTGSARSASARAWASPTPSAWPIPSTSRAKWASSRR